MTKLSENQPGATILPNIGGKQSESQAVELAVQAQKKLVSNGLSEGDAIAKVKSNFDRCNLSGQVITLGELCK